MFDLRKPVLLGSRLKEVPGPGFDHNFCLAASKDVWKERRAARLVPAQVQSRPQLSAPYRKCFLKEGSSELAEGPREVRLC